MRNPATYALLIAVGIAGAAGRSSADPDPVEVVLPPRVIHVPTARMLPAGKIHATGGVNHKKGAMAIFTGGLAGVAELELGLSDELQTCDRDGDHRCGGPDFREHVYPLVAGFKVGVNQGTWFELQPAIALGFRKTFGGKRLSWAADGGVLDPRYKLADLYLMASLDVGGGVHLHGGASLWAARHDRQVPPGQERDEVELPGPEPEAPKLSKETLCPLGAIEYTPSLYPKTTMMLDVACTVDLEADDSTLRMVAGLGARYQALTWGSIELDVRYREDDGLAGMVVMVRINGVFPR